MTKGDLEVISKIYDATINPNYWTECLDHIAEKIGAKGSALLLLETLDQYSYSISQLSSLFTQESKDDAIKYQQEYSHYEKEHFANVSISPPGNIIKDVEYINNPQLFRQRPDVVFLEEKFGVYERFAVRLNEEKAWFDCLTFQYASDRANITEKEFKVLKFFLPHIAKSTELSRIFVQLSNRYDAVLSVLDRFLLGVFIVLPSGEIVLKNTAAHNIIANDDGLRIDSLNCLVACQSTIDEKLQKAIISASDVSCENQVGASHTLMIPKSSYTDGYLVDISPLKDTDNEIDTRIKGAMITVIDPDYGHKPNLEGLKKLYSLSVSESAVAEHLIHGRTYSEIADTRNVSPETIKTQVNAIFNKTNSNSRSELFARAIKITLPIE